MRMGRIPCLLALCLAGAPLPAQETTGALEGRTLDVAGTPISGTTVMVTSAVLQGSRGTTAEFLRGISHLPLGMYSVRIAHVARQPVTIENVRVLIGRTMGLGQYGQEETVELQEVVVIGVRPLIDPRSTTTGVNLADAQFVVLPIDRNYSTMVVLAPQSSPSFYGDGPNITGATGLRTVTSSTGRTSTDAWRGISGTQLPYNFVREVQIRDRCVRGRTPEFSGRHR